MNYTQHYQLPQWVDSDRIMMDDFNDMTQKLDTGLAELEEELTALSNRSRFTKLKEVHINAATTSFEIDLSDIDWTQWANIHLDYLPTNGSQMWLFINSVSDSTRF